MNEELLKAYLNVIEQLLNCASEAELQQFLTDNQELLDRELVQVMKQVAARFEQNGEQEQANNLNFLAAAFLPDRWEISEDEIGKPPTANLEDYTNFLVQVLQATQESNSNPKVVYPLLKNNLDKLDETFAEILSQWATATLPTRESEQAYEIARVIFEFSKLISKFPFGNRGSNLEIVIKAYLAIGSGFKRDAFPYEWARTQNKLGVAYSDRIKGKKAENLETAIACYRESLKVYTANAFPHEWAGMQTNLGNAYWKRIREEKAENLETAIVCYRESLKVYTPEAFPHEWAKTQNNLGLAYSNRIKGEKAKNLETAIVCYRESLKVWDLRKNKISFLQLLLSGFNSLMGKLFKRKFLCTADAFPYEWATTQNNLGLSYSNRIRGKKTDNLEAAIACYRKSLKVYAADAFPYEWASIQTNLGNAYSNRIRGKKTDNLKAAIACYRESLKVFTPEAFPQECLLTGRNLGNLALEEGNWKLAIEAYNRAIEAIEISRSWAMTPESKQEVMEASIDVYYNIVQAYLNTEQNSLALEYVERSKTRNLVELIATRNLKPRGDFPPAIVEQLALLRDEIRTEQIYLANQERNYKTFSELAQLSQPSPPDRSYLKQLQQELDELIKRHISPIDPTFSLTQKVEPIPFSNIQFLSDECTAIVEWYITGENILAFLVTHHCPEPQVWQFSSEDLTNLENWGTRYLETYYTNRKQWRTDLETSLPKLAGILHLDEILSLVPKKCDRLILI